MTGLDTNVLVRYFVKDDPAQTARSVAAIYALTPDDPGWIGTAVLMELAWVTANTYRKTRLEIVQILDTLLASPEIVIEQSDVARRAVSIYRNANISFADCLIASSALYAGCNRTLTFDKGAAKWAGMTLI